MNTLLWVVALLVLGLAVMVLEVFVPSGGILGFVSILALISAVATAFLEQGTTAGMAALAVVVLAVPAVLSMASLKSMQLPATTSPSASSAITRSKSLCSLAQ